MNLIQTTLDLFKIKNPIILPIRIMGEKKNFVLSRMGCEKCNYFGDSFQKLPCGNCIQDYYLHGKHTLSLDELLTDGGLLGKKGIKDLQTTHYVWDKGPPPYCKNPVDQNLPLCPHCTKLFCSTRIYIKLDCSTCEFQGWKGAPKGTRCEKCSGFNYHKPNWPVILEQNQIQREREKKFCKGYHYDYEKWDGGWIACHTCYYYKIEKNGTPFCEVKFYHKEIQMEMPKPPPQDPTFNTSIYGRF